MKDAKLFFHFYRALPWQIQQQDTFTKKNWHCSHRNTPRATCTRATNVRRRLLIAFFARLFNQSMNQKPSQNGFITRSPLVVILEYHNRDLFFHSRFFWLSRERQSSYWLASQLTAVITPPYQLLPPIWQPHFHCLGLLMSCSLRVWILISFVWICGT